MERMRITVAKPTADVLRKVSSEAGLTIGEVVDCVVLDIAPDDPSSAFVVALQQYLVCISRLDKLGSAKVFGEMCGIFLGSLPPDELDAMVSNIKKTNLIDRYANEPITEEESITLKKAVYDTLSMLKDKKSRELLYSVFHG